MTDTVAGEICPHRYDLMDDEYAWCVQEKGHSGFHKGKALFMGRILKDQFYWNQGEEHDYVV